MGKAIDKYYVVKALQLYLEGLSYREVERILGVSHVSVRNWVQMYKIQQPQQSQYHPSYQILTQNELQARLQDPQYLKGHGLLITELGDKFMVIRWERFKDA
jgi:transposase